MTGQQLLTLASIVVVGVLGVSGAIDGDAVVGFLVGAVLPSVVSSRPVEVAVQSSRDDEHQEDV